MKLYLKNNFCYAEVIKIEFDDYVKVTLRLENGGTKMFNLEIAYGKSLFDDENLNAITYKDFMRMLDNSKKLHQDLINNYNFNGFLHETTIKNLINILYDCKLKSRSMLEEFEDSANYEVIEHTAENVKKCVRFYFYHGTPTNYRFEKENPENLVYIAFRWDLIMLDGTRIVDGNASSIHSKSILAKEYIINYDENNFMDWDAIFQRGCLPTYEACYLGLASFSDKNEKIRKRNAEINVPNFVSIDYIDKIIFKSEEAFNRFKELVNDDIIKNKRIHFVVDRNYFS